MDRRLPALDEGARARIRSALYESVGDLEAWPSALREVARVVGATGVVMSVPSFDARQGYSFDSMAVNVDFELAKKYAAESESLDPWTLGVIARGFSGPGLVLRGAEMCTPEEVARSSWKRPVVDAAEMGDVMTASMSMPASTGQDISIAVFHRHKPCDPFEPEAARRLQLFLRDMGAATKADFALRQARIMSTVAKSALDQVEDAIIVISSSGRIEYFNVAAERLLSSGDIVNTRHAKLEATAPEERVRLAELLRKAQVERLAGSCVLGRDSGAVVLNVLPSPFGETSMAGGVLVMARSMHVRIAAAEAIMSGLGLTPAEARVARGIGQGRTPGEISRILQLSPETVRSQLKSVCWKLGVSRQAEVAAIVRAIAPAL